MSKGQLTVLLFVESRYKLDRKRVKKTIASVIGQHGIADPVEVSIAFVGDRKMRELSRKFKNEDKTRNILSFPLAEGVQTVLPGDKLRLGDIVISYPVVIKEAVQYEMMVDDRIAELVEHGLLHLLGLHHE